jgi:hypothetical protein
MISLNRFHQAFNELPPDARFRVIETRSEPTSLFVIFKQLAETRAQLRYFQEREAHLLALAEIGFKQIND